MTASFAKLDENVYSQTPEYGQVGIAGRNHIAYEKTPVWQKEQKGEPRNTEITNKP